MHKKTNVFIENQSLKEAQYAKCLGIMVGNRLNWSEHIKTITSKLAFTLYMMRTLKHTVGYQQLKTIYNALFEPSLTYGITIWGGAYKSYLKQSTIAQKKAVRYVTNATYNAHTEPLFKQLKLLKLSDMYHFEIAKFMFDLSQNSVPISLNRYFIKPEAIHNHNVRHINCFRQPKLKLCTSRMSLVWNGSSVWNNLPEDIKSASSNHSFKGKFKNYILSKYINTTD